MANIDTIHNDAEWGPPIKGEKKTETHDVGPKL